LKSDRSGKLHCSLIVGRFFPQAFAVLALRIFMHDVVKNIVYIFMGNIEKPVISINSQMQN